MPDSRPSPRPGSIVWPIFSSERRNIFFWQTNALFLSESILVRLDTIDQRFGRFVVEVLRDELSFDGKGEDGLAEVGGLNSI